MGQIKAPFSPNECDNLNRFQTCGMMHPFTCANGRRADHLDGEGVLVATISGWVCPYCDYTQDWAHDFMARGEDGLIPKRELDEANPPAPFDSSDSCPKCGSKHILIGAFPLSCQDCGWYHLNDRPCRTCGGPSNSCVGGKSKTIYACSLHPITDAEMKDAFREIAKFMSPSEE